MKRKALIISITSVLSVLVFLGIFVFVWFVGDTYKDFKGNFKKEFAIAGLDEGAVPQGLGSCIVEVEVEDADNVKVKQSRQYFFQSAYMMDGSASRIYVTYKYTTAAGTTTRYVGFVPLANADGTPHTGHVGGVAINNYISVSSGIYCGNLWVTDEYDILVAKASPEYVEKKQTIAEEIIDKATFNLVAGSAGELKSVKFTSSFKANCHADFMYYYDDPSTYAISNDRLYIGEFYRKGKYETDTGHHLKTNGGYLNTAFMYEYNVLPYTDSTGNPYGLSLLTNDKIAKEDKVPKIQKIYSIPEKVQGIAFSGRSKYSSEDGVLVLSQSYGLANSHLLCFDWAKVNASGNKVTYVKATGASFEYEGVNITSGSITAPYSDSTLNVYYVDKNDKNMFISDYSIPCMAEGMCSITGTGANSATSMRVYVLFESAGKKYNKFVREKLYDVYSFIPR